MESKKNDFGLQLTDGYIETKDLLKDLQDVYYGMTSMWFTLESLSADDNMVSPDEMAKYCFTLNHLIGCVKEHDSKSL